jgi:hypothetical protein
MANAGLQVLLEPNGHRFGPELNADVYDPWPPLSGRSILAGIVRVQSCGQIRSHADVSPGRMIHASDDVDEPLRRIRHIG